DVSAWYALYGPAGLASDVASKYRSALASRLVAPGIEDRMRKLGFVAAPSAPAELVALRQREAAFWGPVVKASGFTPED
ncbi:MAG TPA: tripartite tricarboxylate transporter substrate binding protein, partial [Albitalea sp.]|nr:tripartite tricarboxylate transporter substrate binding protein [Albitalea sp.]